MGDIFREENLESSSGNVSPKMDHYGHLNFARKGELIPARESFQASDCVRNEKNIKIFTDGLYVFLANNSISAVKANDESSEPEGFAPSFLRPFFG